MIPSRPAPNTRTMTRFSAIGVLVLAVILTGFTLATGAESGPRDPHAGMSIDDLSNQIALASTMYLVADPILLAQASGSSDSTAGMYGYEPKSPKRAFVQSFLIPGWGQWYNGSRIKPFVFLGLEAAGWLGVSHFHSQGTKKQDQYQKFADNSSDGWDYQRYIQGLWAIYGVASDTLPYRNPMWDDTCLTRDCGGIDSIIVFSHHIALDGDGNLVKNQTYYENVGKYDQFAFGWRDFKDGETIVGPEDTVTVGGVNPLKTASRVSYLSQRAAANREFTRSTTILMLTLGNHLISAFEAALGATRHNRSMDQFGSVGAHVRLAQSQTDGKLFPKLYVDYRF